MADEGDKQEHQKEEKKKAEKKWVPKYGTFCWNELMFTDLETTKAFYKGVFGWESQQVMTDPKPYYMFMAGSEMVGGFIATKDCNDCQPCWLPYVHTKKCETDQKKIEKAKGKTIKEVTEAGGHGRFTIHNDPTGATFALWQMLGAKANITPTKDGDKSVTKPKSPFGWHELITKDSDAALKFYKSALGWGTQDHKMGEFTYHMLCLKGEKDPSKCFGGVGAPEEHAYWLTYIDVPNCDDAAAAATKHGGKVVKAPFDVPTVGRMANITDPSGALFAIIQSFPKPDKTEKMDTAEDKPEKRPSRGKAKKKEEPKEKKEKKTKGKKRKADDEGEKEGESANGEADEAADGAAEKEGEGEKAKGDKEGEKKKGKGRAKKKAKKDEE